MISFFFVPRQWHWHCMDVPVFIACGNWRNRRRTTAGNILCFGRRDDGGITGPEIARNTVEWVQNYLYAGCYFSVSVVNSFHYWHWLG